MPAKNRVKSYVDNGHYHIYNRGVEERTIFQDSQDYKVFLNYLKIYLEPAPEAKIRTVDIGNHTFTASERPLKNFHGQIELLAYCLMPNHFHILIKQKTGRAIENFMRALATKYSVYFNKRHKRVGHLFQGVYKAVLVDNDNYLLHLSRYIHLNPVKDGPLRVALLDTYSSYPDYLGIRKTSWVNPQTILSFFKNARKASLKDILSYQSFVEDYQQDPKETLGQLTLD